MVIARLFGAGSGADAFFVAFRIPNFWRRLFAEGSFSQAFVPILTEYKTQRSHAEVQELADRVTGTLGVVLFGMTLIGVVASPLVVMLFAPGFLDEPDRYGMTVEMLRITFPYLLFVSLAALASGVLNTYGRFGVPAFTPVFLNIAMIVAAIWLAPHLENPITALAWGVFFGGLIQLAFQLPFLKKIHLLPRPRWGWKDSGVRRIVKLMIPALFGVSVTQINLLVDTLIASFLVAGSVSWLYYSDRLVEFPLGVFGIALATVILPALSQKYTEAASAEFSRTLDWALRWVVLIGTPATVGLLLLAGPLLITLFQYGEFSAHDAEMSTRSLMAFSVGLTAYISIKVLAPAFYARQDTSTPVRIGIIAMLSNIVLNAVLVFPLQHAGLALATALAAFINAGLLYRALRRQSVYQPQPGWVKFSVRVLAANVVMALLLWFGAGAVQDWLAWPALTRAAHLALLVGAGALAYLVSLYLAGVKLKEFFKPAVEQLEHGKAS